MSNQKQITEKVYKKLILEINLEGYSFAVHDVLLNKTEIIKKIDFDIKNTSETIENRYWKSFLDNKELTRAYDNILILHNNPWNSFVPNVLFDANYPGTYLKFSQKTFETDSFSIDMLADFEMTNVFIPFANINNFMLDQFDRFDFKHSSSILINKLLTHSKHKLEKQVYIHLREKNFEIIVAENQKLLLYNTFEITAAIDFIYYLMFTIEQLSLNREHIELHFVGNINTESEYFEIAHKFIRNVKLLDLSEFHKNNNFDVPTNLKHFILLQS